jgi:hypothetical protein
VKPQGSGLERTERERDCSFPFNIVIIYGLFNSAVRFVTSSYRLITKVGIGMAIEVSVPGLI